MNLCDDGHQEVCYDGRMYPACELKDAGDSMTLTVNQCAKKLGVVSHTIRKWIWAGQIHAEKIRKGREQWTYLIKAEDWQRFLATRANGSPDSEPTTLTSRVHLRTDYFTPDEVEVERTRRGELMAAALSGCQQSRRILQQEFQLVRWYRVGIGEIV